MSNPRLAISLEPYIVMYVVIPFVVCHFCLHLVHVLLSNGVWIDMGCVAVAVLVH